MKDMDQAIAKVKSENEESKDDESFEEFNMQDLPQRSRRRI